MLSYSSNFKMNTKDKKKKYITSSPTKTPVLDLKISNRLVCKHSILMLMMFHSSQAFSSWQGKSDISLDDIVFFFKPSKIKYFTLLRAPYRYKIARNQISFKRFFLKCSITLRVSSSMSALGLTNSYSCLNSVSKTLITLYSDLDTNICKQDNITTSVPFLYPNYFLIKNYR